MEQYELGSIKLLERIMKRKLISDDIDIAFKRQIYNGLLMIEKIEILNGVIDLLKIELTEKEREVFLKKLPRQIPPFDIETELALKIENQDRKLVSNDLRDMSAYVSAISYADYLIGEKMFMNMGRQAGLNKKYKCKLETSISKLKDIL